MSAAEMRQAEPGARAGGGPLAHLDWPLAAAALVLLGTGLVMVASASITAAERELGEPFYYFRRQLAFACLGLLAAWAGARIALAAWERAAPWLLALGVALLALVLVPGVGHEVNGSARWIDLGPVNLQPSEPAKLVLVVYLAAWLARRQRAPAPPATMIKPLLAMLVLAGLLLAEPDYGATVVLFATALAMLFLGGMPLARFTAWLGLLALLLLGLVLSAPYRLERLTSFLDPWADPYGSGFQLTQALIAIGRGEWLGVGLGASVQKLFYLPEAHTDFIFAVLAEELGLAGMLGVIGLFAFIAWRAFAAGARSERRGRYFGAYLAYGVGLLLTLQAFINVGVNMGVLPTKGLTLPFVSYGGSSLLTSCLAVGLLLRADYESRRVAS